MTQTALIDCLCRNPDRLFAKRKGLSVSSQPHIWEYRLRIRTQNVVFSQTTQPIGDKGETCVQNLVTLTDI